jgi:2-oxoglutarate ferredoxin oxidoreductase subunit delta
MTVKTAEKKKKKYNIHHNHELCKGCGLCYAFCPKDVIEPDLLGRAQIVRPGDCIGCMRCVRYCPDFAIWVEEAKEGAADETTDAEDKPEE